MRASMTENRLTGLALMHIHYAKTVDLDKVIEEFAIRMIFFAVVYVQCMLYCKHKSTSEINKKKNYIQYTCIINNFYL
jgi:hypothetical protein